MSQISPPLRIAIIGSVVFLAAWFVFLKPGGETATPTATTPAATATTVPAKDTSAKTSSSLGADVQKAEAAKQASEASSAASAGESTPSTTASTTGGTAASTAGSTAATTTEAAKPAAASEADKAAAKAKANALPLPVAQAVAAKKVLVLLFWNPKASDDRAVRNAVKSLPTHKGKVVIQIADVKDIARYAPITRGVEVTQSPSVVVVDRELKGNLLVGYNDRQTIDQAVVDALAAK